MKWVIYKPTSRIVSLLQPNHENSLFKVGDKRTNVLSLCVLTLMRSMGVFTASGSGSVWLTVITSCLFRPLRLDFFWESLVMSCESRKESKWPPTNIVNGTFERSLWMVGRHLMYKLNQNTVNDRHQASIGLPIGDTDSLKRKRPALSGDCRWVFFHLLRSSSIKCLFLPSVPWRRSPTYSSISSAFSMDRMYLKTAAQHNYHFI